MVNTLSKIGEQLLEGKGIWARLTTEPNYDPEKKNWVCPILFDCVNKEIRILKDEMELFRSEESAIKFRYVKATRKGPRQSKFDLTVESDDLKNLQESLFGKGKKPPSCLTTLKNSLPEAYDSNLGKDLQLIRKLLGDKSSYLDSKNIKDHLGEVFKDIVLFSAKIKINPEKKSYFLFEHEEFKKLAQLVFKRENPSKGISYVTGEPIDNAVKAQFWSKYNINKIFQTTSYNYASGFEKNNFNRNFQGDDDDFDQLDRASRYVLNNLTTNIAGISHIIIPNYRRKDLNDFKIEETKLYIEKSSDLLFHYHSLESDIDRHLPEVDIFWINYLAFESNGTFFKVVSHIKDVNSRYLSKLIDTFNDVGIVFKDYIGDKYLFNLRSVFNIIPVRDGDKSKINPALILFKEILEQKTINKENIYKHFINLTLCHWYGRYSAFKNIRPNDSFDFAIKDAVFKYSAFIYALNQLNLLNMEGIESISKNMENDISDFQKRIEHFFHKMDYGEKEKALFYLGRILSSIAYAQYKKGHESKPVLNKVNFNGMDADAIGRLSLDLREKARQYNIHRETDWDFGRFTDRFNLKNWPLSKEQNVFYLMAGYSFGLTKSDN